MPTPRRHTPKCLVDRHPHATVTVVVLAGAVCVFASLANQHSAQANGMVGLSELTQLHTDPARVSTPARYAHTPRIHLIAAKKRSQSIAVLVNDGPITNWEIEQRQAFLGMNVKGLQKKAQARFKKLLKAPATTAHLKKMIQQIVKDNQGKSRDEIIAIIERKKKQYAKRLQRKAVGAVRAATLPGLRKKAIEELINERLQVQEARRLNVLVSDDDVDNIIKDIAKRNKMTLKQFGAHLAKLGTNIETMRSRFRAMLSWRNVIRRQFGHQVAVRTGDIDRAVSQAAEATATKSEFKLQRITFAVPANAQPGTLAERLKTANELRNNFSGCASTGTLANQYGGARLENLGSKNAASISEPARSMIQNAADGEMLPPLMAAGGVHLWIVCGRKSVDGAVAQREQAKKTLQLQEFEVLGQRHLKDLRQDAHIEYR